MGLSAVKRLPTLRATKSNSNVGTVFHLDNGRDVQLIHSSKQLKEFGKRLADQEIFAYDTETNTTRVNGPLKSFKAVGMSFSWGEDVDVYIPMNHYFDDDFNLPTDEVAECIMPIFSNKEVEIVCHNWTFDAHVLKRIGVITRSRKIFDTMIASFLCDENREKGLKPNALFFFGYVMQTYNEIVATVTGDEKKEFGLKANNKATFDLVRVINCLGYTTDDSRMAWDLKHKIYFGGEKLLEEEGMLDIYYDLYVPILRNAYDMEERGVSIDTKKLTKMGKLIEEDLTELKYKIYETVGAEFNISSNQQLAELFFGYDKSKNPNYELINSSYNFKPISSTKKGMPQTTAKVFKMLAMSQTKDPHKKEGIDICDSILKYASLEKLKDTFVDGIFKNMYDDGKIHSNINIVGTDSGRFSYDSVNLQQLKKNDEDDPDAYNIREVIIGSVNKKTGKRKKIIAADYSNLEMRINCNFSGDPLFIEMFENNQDTHSTTAKNMFKLECAVEEVKKKYPHFRQAGKVFNFALGYGGGPKAIQELMFDYGVNLNDEVYLKEFKCKTGKDVAKKLIEIYFDTYTGMAKYMRKQQQIAHRQKYVTTLLGRKRRLPFINSSNYMESSYAERLSINSPTQGTAAEITISAQNRIAANKRLKELDYQMLIQVHDEVVGECPEENVEEASEIVKDLMENPFEDILEDFEFKHVPMVVEPSWGDNYREAK